MEGKLKEGESWFYIYQQNHFMSSKIERVIDIHVHYPAINEDVVNTKTISGFKRFLLFEVMMRIYSKYLDISYSKDPTLLKRRAEQKLINTINKSSLSHAVVFGIDCQYDQCGIPLIGNNFLWCDNEYIFHLAKKYKKILPGVSINPVKKSAITDLIYYAKKGAALVKVHPSFQCFDPQDREFVDFCRVAKGINIPILTHVGYESSVPGIKQSCKEQNSVVKFEKALKTGCTIIAAHGGGSPINLLGSEEKIINEITNMSKKFPNLFFDISAIYNIHRPNRSHSLIKNKML